MKLNWVYTLPQQVRVEKANYEKSSVRARSMEVRQWKETLYTCMYGNHCETIVSTLLSSSCQSALSLFPACCGPCAQTLCVCIGTVCEKECEDLRAMRQRRSDHTYFHTTDFCLQSCISFGPNKTLNSRDELWSNFSDTFSSFTT